MELRQLAYFVAVVEEASFTKAAAKLHVAQPGISAQIRRLERELGQPLLDRSGRAVRLTAVGAALLPHARAALGAVAGARQAVDVLAGLLRGHVAIGMVTACTAIELFDVLAGFHQQHPAVEITLCEAHSECLIASLQDGQLDLAWVGLAGEQPPGVGAQVVVDQPLVAAVSHGDPLAVGTTVGLEALRERALVCMPRGTGLRACIDAACATAGIQLHIAFEASTPAMLAQIAARGLGVAILPESTARAHVSALHALSIIRPQLRGRIALAWRAEGPISPAARVLIAHARTTMADRAMGRGGS